MVFAIFLSPVAQAAPTFDPVRLEAAVSGLRVELTSLERPPAAPASIDLTGASALLLEAEPGKHDVVVSKSRRVKWPWRARRRATAGLVAVR